VRSLLAITAIFFVGHAVVLASNSEKFAWNSISGGSTYKGEATGNPSSVNGAHLVIDTTGAKPDMFGGAIGTLDLSRYQGRMIELTAKLKVIDGSGSASIWVRSDRRDKRPEFLSSANYSVTKGPETARALRFYVPKDALNLLLGAIVNGEAMAEFDSLRVIVVPDPTPDVSAYDVLHSALNHVQKRALRGAEIDLRAFRDATLVSETRQEPAAAAYSKIRDLLALLGDRHSFALSPDEAQFRRTTGRATGNFEARLIGDIGYLSVPGFIGTQPDSVRGFEDSICNAIDSLSAGAEGGWVVDLRQNTGGNVWPMLRGLKPLLGRGNYGSFRDRDGNDEQWHLIADSGCKSVIGTEKRVAVLYGPRTASSGEAVAVAFSSRPSTRSFGSPTAGLSTSNMSLDLPDGGALFLTHAISVDRAGREFPEGLVPDVTAGSGAGDQALEAALAWLRL
jgi:carboxyl-terminal processing protease